MVKLVDKEERVRSSDEIIDAIRGKLPDIQGADFNL